ncbi:DUF973 family protein [Caldivirga sp. UBA161]|uniref:DUF973 family protein n=1 Tax=Caldivirga sp. UBA161 TaxID=1915569 RepID=UPI0025BFF430|nr:hypothetical protein [Caldivirga sp. UBA161]
MSGNSVIMIRNAILIYLLGTILLVIGFIGYIAGYIINQPQSYYINLERPFYAVIALNSLLAVVVAVLEYIGFRQLSDLKVTYRIGAYGAVLQLASLPFSIVGAIYYTQSLENAYKVSNISGFTMQALPVKVNSLTYLGTVGSLINLIGWLLVFVVLYKLGSDHGNGVVKTGSLAAIIGQMLAISVVSYLPAAYSYNAINVASALMLLILIIIGGLIAFIGIITLIIGLTSLAKVIER